MKEFKDRLDEAMRIRGITAAELARTSQVNEGAISQYRAGKYKASQRSLDKLARALRVSIPWLMGADVPIENSESQASSPIPSVPQQQEIEKRNLRIDMTKGERIKAAREAAGLSQTDLATATNTSKQTMYKYESDVITNIPSDTIQSIASTLHVSPSYLMGWTEDPTPEVTEDLNDSLVILIRKAKKLSPKQQARLLEMASIMFEEEFKD